MFGQKTTTIDRKGIYMKRLLSVIVFACMMSTSVSSAQPVGNMKEMVSAANGTIKDSYFSGSGRGIIVHIQDLHCNYDAQLSIYNIINELIDKYELNLVSIEGCVGSLETAPYSERPNDKIKEKVAQYFIKTGELDGAGYAHMMRHSGFTFWGADDADLHRKNVEAYKATLEGNADNKRYYSNIKDILERIKQKAYTEKLLELDRNIQAYKEGAMDFSEYASYINNLLSEQGLKREDYPNFAKLIEVLEKEKAIDFVAVDTQRSEYIDFLNEKLDEESLSELLDKSLFFKTGKIGALEFYGFLKGLSETDPAFGMEEDYADLYRYIDYIKLYSQIDDTILFGEIDNMEDSVKDKLFTNEIQRRLDRLSGTLDILRDLFDLKLTTKTLQYYRDNRREFTPAYMINFISDAAKKYGVECKLDPAFRGVAARLPDIEAFYKIAEERDSILVYSTLNQMRNNNSDIAVLVSGGFHTDGITRLLKDNKVSYIVVTPKVEKLYPDNPYKSVLLGGETKLEKLIDKATKNTELYKKNVLKGGKNHEER